MLIDLLPIIIQNLPSLTPCCEQDRVVVFFVLLER
jgi:hypothetical protein